jgi:hypothetical protein
MILISKLHRHWAGTYIGCVTERKYPTKPIPAELRGTWLFEKPITLEEPKEGLEARGVDPRDVFDLLQDLEKRGFTGFSDLL